MSDKNIHQRLMSVQSKLIAPKTQYNKFGKYKYRSLEDIMEAVKPLLAEHGLTLIVSDSVHEIGGRVYIQASARLVNVDMPSESVEAMAMAREPENKKGMDEAQISGSTSSYARKYCLNGLFAIDDCKDADHQNGDPMINTPKQQQPHGLTEGQKAWLSKYCEGQGITTNDAKAELMKKYSFTMDTDPVLFAEIANKMYADAEANGK